MGLNRKDSETFKEYYHRVLASNILYTSNDMALIDLMPCNSKNINDKISTNEQIYYFSITTGYRGNAYTKKRELSTTQGKISNYA